MRAAGDEPHAVRQLLRFRTHRRRGRGSARPRGPAVAGTLTFGWTAVSVISMELWATMRPRVALVDVQHRRIFHAAEILVIEVAQLSQHVAVDGVGHPRVDQREQILIVERPDEPVLAHQP